ncbi:MAG: family 78 glycoside hydrolase catalytic domain, partial [Clostridia bacterium]|nr:family 78 glycoside hydrolase catalytic domain [Clostridia bacterium]
MLQTAHWIYDPLGERDICPAFRRDFAVQKAVAKATLYASARGVYEAFINDTRLGEQVMTPGWTTYEARTQYQEYDVTALLGAENVLKLRTASGWYKGFEGHWTELPPSAANRQNAVIAALYLVFVDETTQTIVTDEEWQVADSEYRFCSIYHGCIYDATVEPVYERYAVLVENDDKSMLIPQEGELILTHERLAPIAVIRTPKGETVLDFGQNLTGSVALSLNAKAGDKIALSFAEILDGDGNFYNANYRRAKCLYEYTCRDGYQEFMPTLTFYGFRYVRVDAYPGEVDSDAFRAVVIHSQMKRTGHFECSDPLINQLYSNVIWGQRGNYLDIPTDCPQRDERLGWTGDAQIFLRTAAYNYDVRKFFYKWLRDMIAAQRDNGGIPVVIPDMVGGGDYFAAAWSDAVAIIPWELYRAYGDTSFMQMMFPAMKRWNDYVKNVTP